MKTSSSVEECIPPADLIAGQRRMIRSAYLRTGHVTYRQTRRHPPHLHLDARHGECVNGAAQLSTRLLARKLEGAFGDDLPAFINRHDDSARLRPWRVEIITETPLLRLLLRFRDACSFITDTFPNVCLRRVYLFTCMAAIRV